MRRIFVIWFGRLFFKGKPKMVIDMALGLCLFVVSGCATYQSKASAQLHAFQAGHSQRAIQFYESNQSGVDKQLFMVEAGRLKLLNGDFAGSHQEFEKAITEIFDVQEGSRIRLKDASGTLLASTVLDDTTRPYNLPGFEAVFAFHHQAINSIFLGNMDAATVELRRALYAQDVIAEKYELEVEKAKASAEEQMAASMRSVDDYYTFMGPVLGRAKSGYQNPYVWYFSALMLERQKDLGNAYIAFKKAWELSPDNKSLQRDVLRLARSQNQDEFASFEKKFGLPAETNPPVSGELIVVIEEGLISQRHSVAIPLLINAGIQKISYPVYRDGPYQPAAIRLSASGIHMGDFMPLCYVQTLAYHDLKERLPGITARNISRFITREVAKQAGLRSNNDTVRLITTVVAGIGAIADEADTRGWYSLPMAVQLLRTSIAPGAHELMVSGGRSGRDYRVPVTVGDGETKLVWLAEMGPRVSIGIASLSHSETSPAAFATTGAGNASLVLISATASVLPIDDNN